MWPAASSVGRPAAGLGWGNSARRPSPDGPPECHRELAVRLPGHQMIDLRTLGALELVSADGISLEAVLTQPKRTALLVYLALASPHGAFRRRDSLLALFWPECDAETARRALRQSLYFLRSALGPGVIVARGDDEVAVANPPFRCDTVQFDSAVEEGRWDDAMSLYRGELLPGFCVSGLPEFERWLESERARVKQRAARAAWQLAALREHEGNRAAAAECGRQAVELSSGDETVFRDYVLLLDRLGDRAAAVRAYESFARDLETQYGVTPSAETQAVLSSLFVRQATPTIAPVRLPPHSDQPAPGNETALLTPAATAPLPPTKSRPDRQFPKRIAAAVLVALLGVGGWRLTARAHQRPASVDRERVVVADFDDFASNSTLGDLIAHVLRGDLSRSPVLSVVGQDAITDALRRMRRRPDTRFTADLARELAARDQIKLTVQGDVRDVGRSVMITAAVIETATGDVIYGASETAADSSQILPTVKRISDDIRHGIGESLASVRTADTLYLFTTSSLLALRKHMQGTRAFLRGDYMTALALADEAIAIDTGFAYAYLLRWQALNNAGLPNGRGLRALIQAYVRRDRLTERERFAIEGNYDLDVIGDVQGGIAALRKHIAALERLPFREAGWYAALGAALELSGDLTSARSLLESARARHPTAANQMVLARVLYSLGNDKEASRVLDDASRQLPGHPLLLTARAQLLAQAGLYDSAHAVAEQIRGDAGLLGGLPIEAEIDATQGQFSEAVGHLRALQDQVMTVGNVGAAVEVATLIARLRIASGDSAAARDVDNALVRFRLDSVDVLARPYLPLALFYANTGQPRRARAWIDAWEHDVTPALRGPGEWMVRRARAAISRAEGNPAPALAALREARSFPAIRVGLLDDPLLPITDHPDLARTYESMGSRDSAIAVYERYIGHHSLGRLATDAFELGPALERLGELYEARGDHVRALSAYRRFVALWSAGDASARQQTAIVAQHVAAFAVTGARR